MAREFKLPDIGEGVTEGEITKWFVKEGDRVKENDPVVEVMTDKVTVQIPSPVTGQILERRAKEGEIVKVGTTLVVFGESGETLPATSPGPAPERPHAAPPPPPSAPPAPPPSPVRATEVLAAPAVRRLARELGVDMASVRGTGPSGRITEADVRAAQRGPAPVPVAAPVAAEATAGREERLPIHGLRKRIYDKMAKSTATAARFTYVEEVDMSHLVQLRERLNETGTRKGVKLSYLPFIIKACVAALKEFPTLNASVDDERQEIVVKRYYNLGIATATDEGLTVTVVHDADRKDLWTLAKEVERLAAAARDKKLGLPDVQGSTFTITSLGKEGGILATPIINWPEVAILGIHKIEKRPVVRDDHIVIREMMYVSCSFDHRVIDGHVGAAFVQSVRGYLEHPAMLFVGLE
jgi:pyruvate dehydrogenase E2 component (dihydrolipoamide acetyltransferase)